MLATYRMEPDETVQQLAQDLYGDPELDWIIHLSNQIVDPMFDYPMTYLELKRYVDSKYTNPYDPHHWLLGGVKVFIEPGTTEEVCTFDDDVETCEDVFTPNPNAVIVTWRVQVFVLAQKRIPKLNTV